MTRGRKDTDQEEGEKMTLLAWGALPALTDRVRGSKEGIRKSRVNRRKERGGPPNCKKIKLLYLANRSKKGKKLRKLVRERRSNYGKKRDYRQGEKHPGKEKN